MKGLIGVTLVTASHSAVWGGLTYRGMTLAGYTKAGRLNKHV